MNHPHACVFVPTALAKDFKFSGGDEHLPRREIRRDRGTD